MKIGTKLLGAFAGFALAACVQVGPDDGEPIHIVMDVNIRLQIEKDVEDLLSSVRELAAEEAAQGSQDNPEENE